MHQTALFSLFSNFLLCTAAVTRSPKTATCFDKDSTPKLTLPWGTYEGKPYGEDGETVLFNNVRFAKPPVGSLRFAAPEYPDPIKDSSKIQDNSFGPNCIQASVAKTKPDDDFPEPPTSDKESEDCLFLDVYVPTWALDPENEEKIPVVVWIFGGAYIFGGKNTTLQVEDGPDFNAYDGAGIRQFTNQGVIWVTGNYRLGAYGFLAGKYMEEYAQPNAGLHDQRLLLDWVQKYIGQVGGDKNAVNVWGLSAGGGSILHHLTAYGGTKNDVALFDRAALWSTAFQWSYDRAGVLQDTLSDFAGAAGCWGDLNDDEVMQCLRAASNDSLQEANQQVVTARFAQGMFPFGPAIDGDLVPDLPANLLKQGKHVSVSSMMLAHNFDEARMFIAKWVDTPAKFSQFVEYAFPGDALAEVRADIEKQYPSANFPNQQARTRVVLRDSTFICNNYQIFQAYKDKTAIYASRYEIPPAQHGSELILLIWNPLVEMSVLLKGLAPKLPDFLAELLNQILVPIARAYQTYLAGHAMTGDPNYLVSSGMAQWDRTTEDDEGLVNAMRVSLLFRSPYFFGLGADTQVSKNNCEFWDTTAQKIAGAMKKESEGKEMDSVRFKKQNGESFKVIVQVDL